MAFEMKSAGSICKSIGSVHSSPYCLRFSIISVLSLGGIVYDPEGQMEISFERGLGTTTNNQVEALPLYQELEILD
jgi:hypothetical protein